MPLRKDGLDAIAIPPPCHAWLCGQTARARGNQRFAAPMPYDEVCLAAGQHDIGWPDWEMRPALDAGTGLPQEYFRVPLKLHIALWREGVERGRVFGRSSALLVSLHADTIDAQYFNFNKASVENAEAVRASILYGARIRQKHRRQGKPARHSGEHATIAAHPTNRGPSNKVVAPSNVGIWDAGNLVRLKHLPLRWKYALARIASQLVKGES